MREDVSIILNEREPAKARVAADLAERLRRADITSSRLAVDAQIVELAVTRQPRVVILDYLLGDYSTGLDVLAALMKLDPETRPRVWFLTDEPGITVAVEAMKLGAADYLDIDNPRSLDLLVRSISDWLKDHRTEAAREERRPIRLDDLCAASPAGATMVRALRGAALQQAPFTVLLGPPGAGLTTAARAMQLERPLGWRSAWVDLARETTPLTSWPASRYHPERGFEVLPARSLVIDHGEADDGSLLAAAARAEATRTHAGTLARGFLTLCTTDREVARGWASLTGAEIIPIAPLSERREDIIALAHRFMHEAEALSGRRLRALDSAALAGLAERTWPGNIRQLRSVIITTLVEAGGLREDPGTLLEENIRRWEEFQALSSTPPTPLEAARALAASGHQPHIAAARLGCSLGDLRTALQIHPVGSAAS